MWVALATGIGGAGFPALAMLGLSPTGSTVLAALLLVVWLVAWRKQCEQLACRLLLASIGLLAASWGDASWNRFAVSEIGRYAPRDAEPVALDVVVTSEPVVYRADDPSPFRAIPSTDRSVITTRAVAVRDVESWHAVSGRCEVTVSGQVTELTPGDRLRVFGQLRRPTPAMNPGQRDAAARDRARRCLATVWSESPSCLTKIGATPESLGTDAGRWIAATRSSALDALDRRLPVDGSALVRAMLLGDAAALPSRVVEAFRHTGTLHILVVSGLHVGLVAMVLPGLAALGWLPRRPALIGSLCLVVAYVLIAGGRPPAVRAGIVAVGILVAALCGRRPLSVNSLAGAAVTVFALSPGAWRSVGTQLSFLATATLLAVAAFAAWRNAQPTSPLDRLIQTARSPVARASRRVTAWAGWLVAATVAVQLVTGPLVASEFHLVSPAAAPLAIAVSPLIATTVASGLCVLLSEMIGLAWVADLAGAVCGGAASGLGQLIEAVAKLPAASFWTTGPAPWWTVTWIAWVALAAGSEAYGLRVRGLVARLGLAVLAAAFAPTLWSAVTAEPELRCSFIAVGHGSSTLVEPPGGGAILVDAGALGSPERAADTIARVLWSRGITKIDLLLLTHPDVDHYNAVPGLLERFDIAAVGTTTRMFSAVADPNDRSGPATLRRLLQSRGMPIRELVFGDRLGIGSTQLTVLHPDDIGVIGSDNANSLVLGIEHAGRRILLPGDLESPGLESVLAQEPYDCDLLLAPHHGSSRSNPPGFAAWCKPETVVISSGEVRPEAVRAYDDAGATTWATHKQGMVTASLSAAVVRIETSGERILDGS